MIAVYSQCEDNYGPENGECLQPLTTFSTMIIFPKHTVVCFVGLLTLTLSFLVAQIAQMARISLLCELCLL